MLAQFGDMIHHILGPWHTKVQTKPGQICIANKNMYYNLELLLTKNQSKLNIKLQIIMN